MFKEDEKELLKNLIKVVSYFSMAYGIGKRTSIKTVTVPPKKSVQIYCVRERTPVYLRIHNPSLYDRFILYDDRSLQANPDAIVRNGFPIWAGMAYGLFLEFNKAAFVYNPNDVEVEVVIDPIKPLIEV